MFVLSIGDIPTKQIKQIKQNEKQKFNYLQFERKYCLL